MPEPYDFNIDHLEQLPPRRDAEESCPPRFRKVAGVLYLLAGVYLPAYIAWEALPDGWMSYAAGPAYWWSMPTLFSLGWLCTDLIIAGATRLLAEKRPTYPRRTNPPPPPFAGRPAPPPPPPPRDVRGRTPVERKP